MPLSPVLGSGQAARLIVKNRKKQKDKSNIVQKLENQFNKNPTQNQVSQEAFQNTIEQEQNSCFGFSILDSSDYDPADKESFLFKMKKLEETEHQRMSMVKSISEKQTLSFQIENQFQQKSGFYTKATLNNYFPSYFLKTELTGGFMTGSGRKVDVSPTVIEKSKKLFDDILCPNGHVGRKNKYNYLSKGCLDLSLDNNRIENVVQLTPISTMSPLPNLSIKTSPQTSQLIGRHEVNVELNVNNLKLNLGDKSRYFFPSAKCEAPGNIEISHPNTPTSFEESPSVMASNNVQYPRVKKITSFNKFSPNRTERVSSEQSFKVFNTSIHGETKGTSVGILNVSKKIFADEDFSDLNPSLNLNLKGVSICGFMSALDNLGPFALQKPQPASNKTRKVMLMGGIPENKNQNKNIFDRKNVEGLNIVNGRHSGEALLPLNPVVSTSFISVHNISEKNENFEGFSAVVQQLSQDLSTDHSKLVEILNETTSEALQSFLNNLSKSINKNNQLLDSELKITPKKRAFCEIDASNYSSGTPVAKRKRLGCNLGSTILVSETGLKKAQRLLEDIHNPPHPQRLETSTPLKSSYKTHNLDLCDLTPIPPCLEDSSIVEYPHHRFSQLFNVCLKENSTINESINKITLNKPTEGDIRSWLDNLTSERQILERRLKVINERHSILAYQRTILDCFGKVKKSIIPGVLFKSKANRKRILLRECAIDKFTMLNHNDNGPLVQIDPGNAHLIHFDICDKSISHIKTLDGAIVVPNIASKVGLSEIEHSFQLMDGVDAILMPKGWIKNHFKWIVWKLASYDQIFSNKLDSLCIENIIQQLKYRYDIEIDQAKRSILRKILEMDEAAQKRMILCVSKIVKITFNTYELELNDGWYSIRTVIDQLLCEQVNKGKIKLGTKLMVYGAEIVNCEGCYPLEAPKNVYLKTNYNATRRAAWWCKLGYQKYSGPFIIPVSSIHPDGGKIAGIKCYILRVYPVKYLEKCGNKNVWRNQKAEERQAQDYQNSRTMKNKSRHHKSLREIRNITDPEQLYDMLQQTQDAESFQELLSATQKTAVYQYSICKSFNDYKAVQSRVVIPVLKLKLADASSEPIKVVDFYLWRPTEEHFHELKEDEVVTIYNISSSSKWGLSSTKTTIFRREKKPSDEKFQKFRRKTTCISRLKSFPVENCLYEFDTVGLVVKKTVNGNVQHVWMTDNNKSLLLVRITEGPNTILVLDNVREGQTVSVCNLRYKKTYNTHTVSNGDHFIAFTKYPKYAHLQVALENLNTDLANLEKEDFMDKCMFKISKLEEGDDNKCA